MQLPDGDKSLHQLRKGGGEGAPALYGFIQLVHLEGQDSGQPSAKYTLTTSLGWERSTLGGKREALPFLSY